MKIKLSLGYDGTDFNGWQIQSGQPHTRTVQLVVEEGIRKLTGENIRVAAAGRTDAGVHARGQVISFETESRIPLERWPLALNSIFPKDVRVYTAEKVHHGFHARFSAKQKLYIYRIDHNIVPDIFWSRYALHISRHLDFLEMKKAAASFEGIHDFRGFCSSGNSTKSYVRTIYNCFLQQNNNFIELKINADGFLYNMVRIITGTLLEVGTGKIKAHEIAKIVSSGEREAAGPTAPAKGLSLEEVKY